MNLAESCASFFHLIRYLNLKWRAQTATEMFEHFLMR